MKVRDTLLNGPRGFGAAPLGNMFRNIPDEPAAIRCGVTNWLFNG